MYTRVLKFHIRVAYEMLADPFFFVFSVVVVFFFSQQPCTCRIMPLFRKLIYNFVYKLAQKVYELKF